MPIKKGLQCASGMFILATGVALGLGTTATNALVDGYAMHFDKLWIGMILSIVFLITGCCMVNDSYNNGDKVKEEKNNEHK